MALVRSFPSWDWRELTFRAVAERAGVSERTVYRHFPTEQELSSAVMRRLEEEAGVDYEGLRLAQLAKVTARVFEARSSFAVLPTRHSSPFAEENDRRRQALLAAVADLAAGWSDSEVETVAASLDVIWSEGAYRRLTGDWGLTTADATQAVSWIIDLIVDAVESGRRPRKRRR